MKEKFVIQVLLKTSAKVLESKISTPAGLGEWFCEDVNEREGHYFFKWDNHEEKAALLAHKPFQFIRFKWSEDEENNLDTFFEIATEKDALTSNITLVITDFSYPEDKDNSVMMWEQQIVKLRRLIGS
ncbi:MAG: SRPBCC domain-containing protein [Bacteroidetes bacterium]|nr:SRPBCC domain-containing protein [Bacteroidota bacterium]MBM3424966.1 SRPBCC domain-containing protein [Bacteroidota bacterium]